MDVQWQSYFSLLAQNLVEFRHANQASTFTLEKDQYNPLFQLFVAFGASISIHQLNVSVVGLDGTYSHSLLQCIHAGIDPSFFNVVVMCDRGHI